MRRKLFSYPVKAMLTFASIHLLQFLYKAGALFVLPTPVFYVKVCMRDFTNLTLGRLSVGRVSVACCFTSRITVVWILEHLKKPVFKFVHFCVYNRSGVMYI